MSANQMNTTNGVVVREVLLDQSNYARFRDFLKTKMVDEKIEDEAVEICFRVVKTVEMVEFTTPAGKKKADTKAIARLETTSCSNGTHAPRWDGKGD